MAPFVLIASCVPNPGGSGCYPTPTAASDPVRGAEDLSGAERREHRKTGGRGLWARIGPFPQQPLARLGEAPLFRGLFVAEADGNRTRRRAFARPPILKACPAFWYLQPCDQRLCLQAPSQNVQRLVRPIRLEDLSGGP
jgi:hypothetical protein